MSDLLRPWRRGRLSAARRAALAAAEQERAFGEDHVVATVLRCHLALERAREQRDWQSLTRFVMPAILEDLRSAWSDRGAVVAPRTLRVPEVRLVSLENAADATRGRFVVELGFGGGVSPLTGTARRVWARELWTFARDEGRWKLAAVERDDEGADHFRSPLLGEAANDPALAGEAAFELAAADAVPDGALSGGLTGGPDPRRALAELALLDERFAWHVVAHVVDGALDAWARAAERGSIEALLVHTSEGAARTLLGDTAGRERVVVRSLSPCDVTPVAVRSGVDPVSLTLVLMLRGRLALRERAGGGVTRGSLRRRTTFVMRWRLVVDGGRPGGWRVEAVTPGWLDDALGARRRGGGAGPTSRAR